MPKIFGSGYELSEQRQDAVQNLSCIKHSCLGKFCLSCLGLHCHGLETSDNIPTYEEQFADYFVKVWREVRTESYKKESSFLRFVMHNENTRS